MVVIGMYSSPACCIHTAIKCWTRELKIACSISCMSMSLGFKPPRKLAIRSFALEGEDVLTPSVLTPSPSVAFVLLISSLRVSLLRASAVLLRDSTVLGPPGIFPLLVLPLQDIATHKVAATQKVSLTLVQSVHLTLLSCIQTVVSV